MEWVETTAKTVEEAKDSALDQLGIDESEAEFEVIEEPKAGLFGRVRGEARVRARIQPTQPRPKVERRDRKRSKPKSTNGGSRSASDGAAAKTRTKAPTGGSSRSKTGSSKAQAATGDRSSTRERTQSMEATEDATVEQQAEIIEPFLEGLVEAFSLTGSIEQERIDDDTIELRITGEDLGLLIGPKGQTLSALQDLSRTVVQRRVHGSLEGRVRLDVSGYRQRRREALERFATGIASEVKESGVAKALEAMNAADRKVVHDTVNGIDGVSTASEGEDLRRHVVILPDES